MPVGPPVPFVPGTMPGQAADESVGPEHLDFDTLLSVRAADAFRGAPVFASLISFLAESFQLGETMLQELRASGFLPDAAGVQLDRMLADLGGQRNGRNDQEMRRLIPARWSALFRERSLCSLYDLLRILCDGVGATFTYHNTGNASYMVTIVDISIEDGDEFDALLRLSKPEGVGLRTLVILREDNAFRFDIGPGLDQGVVAHYGGSA